ncbi:MAG: GNAT family N-acetyltransferase [Gemmatimonadaceae bacterium]|nr:GNAT family N-acetyltransferase [Gemmatimonadaceae bacterium]
MADAAGRRRDHSSTIRRALDILRDEGVIPLIFRILGETVYRRMLVFETDLVGQVFAPDEHCRWLRTDEVGAYARFHPALSEDEVKRRRQAGHRCWVYADDDGRIVHGFWFAAQGAWLEYLQMELRLEPGQVYLYQSWTAPEHRGRGLAPTTARALKHVLKAEGIARTVACVQPDRAVVYSTHARSGATPTAYIGWFRIGPWRWTFRRTTDHLPFYAPAPRTQTPTTA